MALTDKLTAIADAIRSKTGTIDLITLDDMPSIIEGIETGGSGATEPYVEETYDEDGNLIAAKLVGHEAVREKAFYGCTNLASVEFPESLTSIKDYAFYNCSSLTSINLPESLTTIGSYAFRGCTNLTSLTFKCAPTSIYSTVFSGCTNLTTINVPWSEGEVANAPWGATNATINYDYIEETEETE